MSLQVELDGSGNSYVRVGNLRITLIHKANGWAGPEYSQYLRIQAYKNPPQSEALHMGAEIPIAGLRDACHLNAAINHLLGEAFPATEDEAEQR